MSFIKNVPESLSLTSSNDIENPTSSQLSVDKKMANNLTQAQKKILLEGLRKRVDDHKKRREAGNLVPESLSLTSSNDIENPASSQLSVDKKMANNLTQAQKKIMLEDLCKRVDDRKKRREAGNLDPNDPQDIPLLCSYVPSFEEIYLARARRIEKHLEFKKKQREKWPVYYQWSSECKEIEKTTKLTANQKFKLLHKIQAQHDKSSGE